MARGGGSDKPKSLEEMGVPKEEIIRLTTQVYERNIQSTIHYLTDAIKSMNKALRYDGKIRGGLVDLAASVNCLANTVSGIVEYQESRHDQVGEILGDVVEGRDDYEKAINARYKLKLADIIQASLERQLKEKETK